MTHLALRLTTRSEARNTQRHALRLTARSEAMTHLALRLTARSEARNHTTSCFTSNSEVRSNDSSCFTSNSEVKSKENIYTPPFREGPFGLYQAYLESVQTLHEIEA
jgi:hypothetical protein